MFSGKKLMLYLLGIAIAIGFSWGITCGIVWLICLCFGLKFKLLIGTGVWLVFCLINLCLKKK